MDIHLLTRKIDKEASILAQCCIQNNIKIITAESCTGGIVSRYLINIAGASSFIEGGFVTYSNQMKIDLLNVDPLTLQHYGAVSKETVTEMTIGALEKSANANLSLAITGIAGPEGGTKDKPVGLVWIGIGRPYALPITQSFHFSGNRKEIRLQSVIEATKLAIQVIKTSVK